MFTSMHSVGTVCLVILMVVIGFSEGRTYSATFFTSDYPGCASPNDFELTFIKDCVYDIGVCDGTEVRSETFVVSSVPTRGEFETYSFEADDIGGDITHLQLSVTGNDDWCLSTLNVLINDDSDLWSTCSFQSIGSLIVDGDATEASAVGRTMVLDVSPTTSRICKALVGGRAIESNIMDVFGIQPCPNKNCNGIDDDPNCLVQRRWGCACCDENSQYFIADRQYPCMSCDLIDNCLECQNFVGCATCEEGYRSGWNRNAKMYTCKLA